MKKIIKNCLIGVSLVVMLAFTFFLSINSKESVKANTIEWGNRLEYNSIIEKDTNYYFDTKAYINYMEQNNYSKSLEFYGNEPNTVTYQILTVMKAEVYSDSGIIACNYDDINNTCESPDYSFSYNFNGTMITGSTYYKVSINFGSYQSKLYLDNNVGVDPANITYGNIPYAYIINENIYMTYNNKLLLKNGEPVLLGNINENVLSFQYTGDTTKYYVNKENDVYVPKPGYIYTDVEIIPPPPSSNDMVSSIVSGLSSIFTNFIPSFIGAVVLTAQTVFITESGTGTIVLGAIVAACGIALTISILRFVLNLIKLKRKV